MARFTYTNTRLRGYIAALPQKADALAAAVALDWQGFSRTIAPVLTGNLRRSILFERVSPGVFRVYVEAEYGIFVEFGTYKMSAQPFFYPGGVRASKGIEAHAKRLLAL